VNGLSDDTLAEDTDLTIAIVRAGWRVPIQQFVYRQLMYLVIIESTISAVIGVRAHWQTIPRTGDVKVASDSP
jgi:cellulose synthase/poly-beta-1,6-N-acetylglucosamine synthase-like glycosyltransferase